MYYEDNLSASQIAQRLDLSKTSVLERLRKIGIRNGAGKLGITDPKNYRHMSAPIGWKVKEGKLVPHKNEIKTCRLIVHNIRSGHSLNAVAKELVHRKIKNRNGVVSWNAPTLRRIYKLWKDKL